MIKYSCKGCKYRTIYCHSTCKKYLENVKANEELKKKQRLQKVYTSSSWGYSRKRKDK